MNNLRGTMIDSLWKKKNEEVSSMIDRFYVTSCIEFKIRAITHKHVCHLITRFINRTRIHNEKY